MREKKVTCIKRQIKQYHFHFCLCFSVFHFPTLFRHYEKVVTLSGSAYIHLPSSFCKMKSLSLFKRSGERSEPRHCLTSCIYISLNFSLVSHVSRPFPLIEFLVKAHWVKSLGWIFNYLSCFSLLHSTYSQEPSDNLFKNNKWSWSS